MMGVSPTIRHSRIDEPARVPESEPADDQDDD